ncbi:conserved hypothetical protein [Tenacibaculum litopenaei]|uniref:hypothetical protein n=1 Tax=Tenacibaculum litopenaei TaxID=396016 RepID=UPI0038932A53
MKTYVLIISENFPKKHKKSGEPTNFIQSIKDKTKKHTLRQNYSLWEKRFDEINKGNACLSIRVWTGKPYRSSQKEVFNFVNTDGIGLEKYRRDLSSVVSKSGHRITTFSQAVLAQNDGLEYSDFKDWFKGANILQPLALIHFSGYRYQEEII